jgi:hypothetical protein
MKVQIASVVLAAGLGILVGFKFGKLTTPKVVVRNCEAMVIENEVKTAVSLLAVMQQKYIEGEIGLYQAKQIGKDLVENLYFGQNDDRKFVVEEVNKSTASGVFKMEFKPFGWVVRVR